MTSNYMTPNTEERQSGGRKLSFGLRMDFYFKGVDGVGGGGKGGGSPTL